MNPDAAFVDREPFDVDEARIAKREVEGVVVALGVVAGEYALRRWSRSVEPAEFENELAGCPREDSFRIDVLAVLKLPKQSLLDLGEVRRGATISRRSTAAQCRQGTPRNVAQGCG